MEENSKKNKRIGVNTLLLVLLLCGVCCAIALLWHHNGGSAVNPVVNVCVTNSIPQIEIGMPSVSCSVTNLMPLADGMQSSDLEEGGIVKDEKDALAALLLINHINCSVTRIKNANDAIVLEEEYNSINQNAILLDAIKDKEMVELICDIMDAIVSMRIEEKERRFLKEELDQGMSDAMYDAIPNPLNLISANPISAICNIATAAASSYMNYKKAKANLTKKFKRSNWELDKNRMVYLNELNKCLLEKYWVIVDRYKLPDYYRVVEDDVIHLIDRLKDESRERRYAFLKDKDVEETYKFLPVYWYHRGRAAYENGDMVDAMTALGRFQIYEKDYSKILRHNKTAASVAMLKLNIMMQASAGTFSAADFDEQLKIIERNATKDDWNMFYYAALVYSQELKNFEEARRLLVKVIDEMEFARDSNLIDWKEFIRARMDADDGGTVDGKNLMGNDALFSCKSLLSEIETYNLPPEELQKRLVELCEADNSATREKLFCYCSLDFKGALKYLDKDIRGIRFQYDGSVATQQCINVALPLSWIIGREGDMTLYCRSVDSEDESVLKGNVTRGARFDEVKAERKMLSIDGEEKVVLRFVPRKANYDEEKNVAVLVMRYDRGVGKAFQIAVQTTLKKNQQFSRPTWEGLGKWVKGDRVKATDVVSKWDSSAYFKRVEYEDETQKIEVEELRSLNAEDATPSTKSCKDVYSVVADGGAWRVYKNGKPTGFESISRKDCEEWIKRLAK